LARALGSVVFLASMLVPVGAHAEPNPVTCEGYPEARVFLEAQGWWVADPGQTGSDFGHLHMGTCFPLYQAVSGVVAFDVRTMMHDNPGELFHILPRVCLNSSGTCYNAPDVKFVPPHTCETDCEFWTRIDVDTARYPYDGLASIRFRAEALEPDGNKLRASNDWLVYVSNGNPVNDFRQGRTLIGKGWYTGQKYALPRLLTYPLPTTGVITLKVRCGASKNFKECLVSVDPDFHAGNDGNVLLRATSAGSYQITLDTSAFSPGTHALVLRTKALSPLSSTLAGVLKVPFVVGG
jgi:hypothetical protein